MRHLLSRLPRPWLALLMASCLALLAACGGGHPRPGAATGSLTVTIGGLPAGVAGAVTLSGPASYILVRAGAAASACRKWPAA